MSELYIAPEHEFEAQPGLPEVLPRDEKLIWQGSPHWKTLAIHAFHLRQLSIYFVILLALRAAFAVSDGATAFDAAISVVTLLPLPLIALGLLAFLAWQSAQTAVYTVTNKRVVMRIGVVLSVTFNLPYARIEAASMKRYSNDIGDIPLSLAKGDRIAYLHLWPHARPWLLSQPQPMLRAVENVSHVAELLSSAMANATGGASNVSTAVGDEGRDRQIETSGQLIGAS